MGFLIVDYGTSSCRASLVSENGRILCTAKTPVRLLLRGSEAEIELDVAWGAVVRSIREVLETRISRRGAPEPIRAVGVSALLCWVFLDSRDEPLGNALTWMDRRASAQAEELGDILGRDALYGKTRRRSSPELLAPSLLWHQKYRPEVFKRTARIMGLKDEILHRLTGEVVTDYAHLNYTLLWNVGEHRPDPEMLSASGAAESLLAPGGYAMEQGGYVDSPAAALTGLTAGTPVIRGTSDGTAAMYGGGIADAGTTVLVSGTTDVLMCLSPRLPPGNEGSRGEEDAFKNVLSVNTGMIPGTFALGGATGLSGGALNRMSELLGGEYPEHIAGAEALPPGSGGLLATPGFSGERAPYWDPLLTGGFAGLNLAHRSGHIIRAVLEGCAYRIRRLFQEMLRAGAKPETLNVVGGCARIPVWNRIRADVLKLTVRIPGETEATTIGTALFCASFLEGGCSLREISRGWIRPQKEYPPDRANSGLYDRYFELYEEFVFFNGKICRKLEGIKENL